MSKFYGEPLSFDEMQRYLKGFQSTIFEYNDLSKYQSLEQLFKDNAVFPFIVIFHHNTDGDIGHFTLLIQESTTNKIYNYYDPFGRHPDHYGDTDHFKNITTQSGERLYFIQKQLQNSESNNCGRYCLHRINSIKMTTNEYYSMMDKIAKHVMPLEQFVYSTIVLPTIE